MNKRLIISIFIVGVAAAFFYASAWTCEESVSAKWAFTGFIALGQMCLTGVLWSIIGD